MDELVAKERLALSAYLVAYQDGRIELGHRNADRMVADALGSGPQPISRVWLDSAMTKLEISNYFELAEKANQLSKSGGLELKPRTSNAVELQKVLTRRDEIANGPRAAILRRQIARDEKVGGF